MNNSNNFNNYDFNRPFNFTSNVTFVTSLDEALYKTNLRNSDMIYFHQDQNIFYRVKVDDYGHKTWAQFDYSAPKVNKTSIESNEDLQSLIARLEKLEKTVYKEVATNGESNG